MTLIEEWVAQKLAPRGRKEELRIEAIGGKRINDDSSYRLNVKIKGIFSKDLEEISVQTIKSLNLSPQSVSRELLQRCSHLTPIKDELIYERSRPTILIGQNNWHLIVTRELISGGKNLPVASLTKLGWVLHGHISGGVKPIKIVNHISTKKEEDMEKLIKNYFSLESLGVSARKPTNDPEERALNILNKTVRRIPNNRYETALLWRTDNECMPSNRAQFESLLFNIERKLDKNSELKKEYEKQIENLIVNGYAEKANNISISPRTWYLPHFAVTHPQKRKIRIVFDAVARTGGRCLNDALLTGPDLLKSLFGVLLRFREGSVAVMADIKEMFLQVKIREEDRDSLRFLWRHNRDAPPEEYRMTSLIFGAASSPCIAIYVKNRNTQDNAHIYPEAASATESNFYMDDYLQAFPDVTTAERIVNDMYELHKRASFQLRGWASNRPEVLSKIENKHKSDVSHRWFQGPEFLRTSPDLWPKQVGTINSLETGEEKSPKSVNALRKQEPLKEIPWCNYMHLTSGR
ncbi:unnamed protein product [Parnassius apollo]|uniref:(apollo) hypothetical protein n=1 Tax=Parnassius apollo TaxID=110799 RepID=A0A8S3YEL1_PARAO|nr:unnamed protein product [Parnassius apollo]